MKSIYLIMPDSNSFERQNIAEVIKGLDDYHVVVSNSLTSFGDTKTALIEVVEENTHVSWELPDGNIVSFEIIADNSPSISYSIDSKKDYAKNVLAVHWIVSSIDYDTLKKLGSWAAGE